MIFKDENKLLVGLAFLIDENVMDLEQVRITRLHSSFKGIFRQLRNAIINQRGYINRFIRQFLDFKALGRQKL